MAEPVSSMDGCGEARRWGRTSALTTGATSISAGPIKKGIFIQLDVFFRPMSNHETNGKFAKEKKKEKKRRKEMTTGNLSTKVSVSGFGKRRRPRSSGEMHQISCWIDNLGCGQVALEGGAWVENGEVRIFVADLVLFGEARKALWLYDASTSRYCDSQERKSDKKSLSAGTNANIKPYFVHTANPLVFVLELHTCRIPWNA